jgi:hypothetical protein
MKKLLLLSVLLGLMTLPMFASDITFGGDLTYGFISDFADNEADSSDVNFDINATVDDHNSVSIEVDVEDFALDKAVVTTNIGTWLDLPVGVTLDWGYIDPNANRFQGVSERGNEKTFDFSSGDYWGLNLLATIEMIEIELAIDPCEDLEGVVETDDDGIEIQERGRLLVGAAVKEPIPGLNAELYYFQNNSDFVTFDEGVIGVDASYETEFSGFTLKAGAGFGYPLPEASDWSFGVGLKGTYSIAAVTIGFDGNESDMAAGLTATVAVDPIDLISIYAGLELDMTEAAADAVEAETRGSILDGVDAGIQVKMGAASLYVGYLITDVESGNWKAPAALTDGGAYLKLDIDY